MTNTEVKSLPVEPFAWSILPVSLALVVAQWVALLAWLLGGYEGAGNLFMAWAWFCAGAFTLAAAAPLPGVLRRGPPIWLRVFFRFNGMLQAGVLAWFACWWLLAATVWAILVAAADRRRIDKQIAIRAAAHA